MISRRSPTPMQYQTQHTVLYDFWILAYKQCWKEVQYVFCFLVLSCGLGNGNRLRFNLQKTLSMIQLRQMQDGLIYASTK